MIYLDYMATTPVDQRVIDVMTPCLGLDGCFGNPASRSHRYGYDAAEKVSTARQQVADLVNADPREIVWTSGATESNNLAIKGAAHFYQRKGKHIVTMSSEHKAVLDTCHQLESEGFEVTYIDPEADGSLDINKLEAALRDDTILVSIMHVNNEIGAIQDIKAIAQLTRPRGIIFHSDAAQSAGKVAIDVQDMDVDLMSFSSHKVYGPKGMGALYVRRTPRVRLEAQIHGGGHERGMRSGTLATHQIVGMGEAFAIAKDELQAETQRICKLRDKLWQGLQSLPNVYLNSCAKEHVCGCLNVAFDGIESEALLCALPEIAVSTGSACNSASPQPSHVLLAMGLLRERANCSIRFSVGRFTTAEDVKSTVAQVCKVVTQIRQRTPLWDKAAQEALKKGS